MFCSVLIHQTNVLEDKTYRQSSVEGRAKYWMITSTYILRFLQMKLKQQSSLSIFAEQLKQNLGKFLMGTELNSLS